MSKVRNFGLALYYYNARGECFFIETIERNIKRKTRATSNINPEYAKELRKFYDSCKWFYE